MTPKKSLPFLMSLVYHGFNRALPDADGARGDFQPVKDLTTGRVERTFCNLFVQFVCSGMGYSDFYGMEANEMVNFMLNPANGWISVADEYAQQHANDGVIVIAGHMTNEGHGHVCLIVPGQVENSGSYGKSVPQCVNVGKDVFFGKKVSYAFKPEEAPLYFALSGMIT